MFMGLWIAMCYAYPEITRTKYCKWYPSLRNITIIKHLMFQVKNVNHEHKYYNYSRLDPIRPRKIHLKTILIGFLYLSVHASIRHIFTYLNFKQ